ncbi:hypothetical protein [Pseudomonas putida]|uniref:hypothetical protein n=1 Tax=Pseudomonas putida TaxID=303 RepID=UPI00300F6660
MIVHAKPNLLNVLITLKDLIARRTLMVSVLACHLPLDAIERDVLSALGCTELPAALQPVEHILS